MPVYTAGAVPTRGRRSNLSAGHSTFRPGLNHSRSRLMSAPSDASRSSIRS